MSEAEKKTEFRQPPMIQSQTQSRLGEIEPKKAPPAALLAGYQRRGRL
jgi:hypothetical protein